MNMPTKGWKKRRSAAAERHEADDERAAIRAQRQELYEVARLRDAAAAIQAAELQKRARCSCPVCDGDGAVSVEMAELVIRAMARLPAHVPANETVMLALRNIAYGREVDRRVVFPDQTELHLPHRVYAAAVTETAEPVSQEPARITAPSTKPSRKLTAVEAHAVADGAILDLDD